MKVAILAGGIGSRLAEETHAKPKPMIEIGGEPLLWHIMRYYAHHGFTDFVIALGYRGDSIKQYFRELDDRGDRHFDCGARRFKRPIATSDRDEANWRVELVDTGPGTNTGGRILRLAPHLIGGTFMLTWGDGVSDVDLRGLLAFHRRHGRLATVTAVRPPSRFGHLSLDGDEVIDFDEKPTVRDVWINGAYFVLEPGVFDYIDGDDTQWERGPMQRLARDRQLMAYRHDKFWQCMDTVHDRDLLERLWDEGRAPWGV